MYLGLSLAQTECFLLAVMAWDRYVAICKPFHYQQIMNNQVCVRIAIMTWAGGFIYSLASLVVLPSTHFCGRNVIDHTFCEPEAISQLVCIESRFLAPALAIVSLVSPLSFILFTYFRVIFTIVRMPTADRKRRAFATCGSHLLVVTLFYGTAMGMYLSPKSSHNSKKGKSMSVFYCLVVPALNPLIYTLRNKDVKGALRRTYNRNNSCQQFT
ncbi:hypothetical protein NDU88_012049 [Pleurodeles waltl]|uniref:Olfactory receptor n=2 Tax=Pleurodeles waltl TaxID=8319 RepID=A0AAV7S625_PLEWA|nr:hypothetical protein NDU88_012049 [Pleurodeles waltl]